MIAMLRHDSLRPFYALAWTALVLLLLLQSSSQPILGPPAPPGDPPLEREILLFIGHLVAFSVMTWLWFRALRLNLPPRRALIGAVLIALTLGTLTELAQATLPDRSASCFDLATNWAVTLLSAWRLWNNILSYHLTK
jgi:VanZ family protein